MPGVAEPAHRQSELGDQPVAEGRRVHPGDPHRLVCGRCGFVFYLDPKVAVGTIIWLSSELMFFAALFASYFTIRSVAPEMWAENTALLNVPFASVNTTILVLSSVTCQMGVWAAERLQPGRTGGLLNFTRWGMREWYVLTFVLGGASSPSEHFRFIVPDYITTATSAVDEVVALGVEYRRLEAPGLTALEEDRVVVVEPGDAGRQSRQQDGGGLVRHFGHRSVVTAACVGSPRPLPRRGCVRCGHGSACAELRTPRRRCTPRGPARSGAVPARSAARLSAADFFAAAVLAA